MRRLRSTLKPLIVTGRLASGHAAAALFKLLAGQFQATLTGSATSGYVLVVHVSQQHLAFTVGGWLTSVTDRNGNVTSFGYSPYGYPSSITSARTRRRTRRERGGIGGEQYPIPWPREIEVVATWDQSG